MAIYLLLPPSSPQLMGQEQSLQHHFTDGVSPRHHTHILHGAPPFEKHNPLNWNWMELDIPSQGNISNYLQSQNRGGQQGRMNSGPRSGMPSAHLNYRSEGKYNKKNYWNKNVQRNSQREKDDQASKMSDSDNTATNNNPDKSQGKSNRSEKNEKDERNSRVDCKGIKRQHEFYPSKLNGGWRAYYNGHGQNLYDCNVGNVGCSIPVVDGGGYQSGINGNKRRFQMDHRYFLFRGQRGRRTGGGGLGLNSGNPLLDRSFLRFQGIQGAAPPDIYLSKAHLFHAKVPPPAGSKWDKLSQGIWKKFIANHQSEETFKKKMLLWKHLYILIKNTFPRYGLYLVGSTMSGFGSNNSDVDMCLLVRYSEMDQRNEAVGHLDQILHCLRRYSIDNAELIQAKVPILKFSSQGIKVDLNCNNSVGIRNTHLLHFYSRLDWRVRPLVLIVKLWAHKHNINDAKNMTVSSGVSPYVLPCLHEMYHGKFSPHLDIHQINLLEDLLPYNSKNSNSLGELFLGFLYYYAFEFDFSQYAVSVRCASKISIEDCKHVRTYKNDPHQWKYLCIEEPFDLTNTARSVYDKDVFERVKEVFRNSWETLVKSENIDCLFGQEKD
ncbi:hypothetical protein J437_LFUL013996 [Ladona fulva]|uniref:PAP-associated domain-containing protein n=1 Tax=Ladona fulva TaxID=123851 RepID=A0A8K0KGP6_LADFU|nr:hypothetical protein J437_LFUL013996 [Ladona fulva]